MCNQNENTFRVMIRNMQTFDDVRTAFWNVSKRVFLYVCGNERKENDRKKKTDVFNRSHERHKNRKTNYQRSVHKFDCIRTCHQWATALQRPMFWCSYFTVGLMSHNHVFEIYLRWYVIVWFFLVVDDSLFDITVVQMQHINFAL